MKNNSYRKWNHSAVCEYFHVQWINSVIFTSALELIKKEDLFDECNLILYETNHDKIPSYIKSVPTIIAPNLLKPLVGVETIEWIKNRKYFNQTTNNIEKNNVISPEIK